MAIVQPKSLKYRKAAAHTFILAFLCTIMFPLLMIVAISFRQGNFSVGDIIPSAATSTLDHWRLALGFNVRQLNRVTGSTIDYVETDDGKYQILVRSEDDSSFRNYVTEPFSISDVKAKASADVPYVVNCYTQTSDAESAQFADASTAKENNAVLESVLAMKLGEGSTSSIRTTRKAPHMVSIRRRLFLLHSQYYCGCGTQLRLLSLLHS